MSKSQSFLLIVAAAFLIILIYVMGHLVKFGPQNPLGLTSGSVEIIIAGDVMLGRTVMEKSLKLGDPAYPFRKVADRLKEADLVFVNLESPIVLGCPESKEGFKFCADPKMVEGLILAGVDMVSLANNHTGNYGEKGLGETRKLLEEKGIGVTGSGNLVVKEVKDTKFGFLGFDFISKAPAEKDWQLVKDSDGKVDVLVVGVHWGSEYQAKAGLRQREWAKKLVEVGADVVAGHHPHWVEDDEKINGKPVYYSLGNFVFDQMWSEKTRQGLAVKLTFEGTGLVGEEKLPIFMTSWAQPEFSK